MNGSRVPEGDGIVRLVINGKEREFRAISLNDQSFIVGTGVLRVMRLEDEWAEDVHDPHAVVSLVKNSSLKTDIFTFWQRPPDTIPMYDFYRESESLTALRIDTYDLWFQKKIQHSTRKAIRRAEKNGVSVVEIEFNKELAVNMAKIFNETPIRQGRKFWHYGKSAETIQRQFSRFIFRERIFGSFYQGDLIGFLFVGIFDNFATIGQIISMVQHRDKAANNLLISKAVEICADLKVPYLIYGEWSPPGGLADFKRANGFEKLDVPRYFVPITWKGRVALRAGIHRDWKEAVPPALRVRLKNVKSHLVQIGR